MNPRADRIRQLSEVRIRPFAAKTVLIAFGGALIAIGGWLALDKGWIAAAIVAFAAGVWTQHAIAEEVHDGVHYRLLPDRRTNELMSGFWASAIGISFDGFRVVHLRHHRLFGTPEDPDYAKYAVKPSGPGGWLRYFALNFCGFNAFRTVLATRAQPAGGARHFQHPCGTALLHGTMLAASFASGSWVYPLFWLLPLVTVTYGITQFRTLLEHWDEVTDGSSRGGTARGAYFNLTGRVWKHVLASQFNYNLHGAHHQLPSIPNYNLARAVGEDLTAQEPGVVQTRGFLGRLRDVFGAA